MSATTDISIPVRINYHPAEERPIRVDFAKQLGAGEALDSGHVEVQSQASTADPLPVPGISQIGVEGTAVLFELHQPEVDTYELLVVATTADGNKKAAVLTVNVALR